MKTAQLVCQLGGFLTAETQWLSRASRNAAIPTLRIRESDKGPADGLKRGESGVKPLFDLLV
tara:strand:- start:856 stop:1041 length:186 start_codon:yes stop_codon:yes gene_type:complete